MEEQIMRYLFLGMLYVVLGLIAWLAVQLVFPKSKLHGNSIRSKTIYTEYPEGYTLQDYKDGVDR